MYLHTYLIKNILEYMYAQILVTGDKLMIFDIEGHATNLESLWNVHVKNARPSIHNKVAPLLHLLCYFLSI